MKNVFLFILWIFFVTVKISDGVLCIFCTDVTSLSLCNDLTSCEIEWKCFSQSWLNENRTRFFSKGCYNPSVKECKQFTDNCLPTKPLLQCCQTDLCNVGNPFLDWRPRKPEDVIITNISKKSVKIQWKKQCDNLYSYQIIYFLNKTDTPSVLMTLNLTGENSAVIDSVSKGRYIISIRSFYFNIFSEIVSKVVDVDDAEEEEDIVLSRTNLLIISITIPLIIFICLVVFVVICVKLKKRKNRDIYVVDRIYEAPSNSGAELRR